MADAVAAVLPEAGMVASSQLAALEEEVGLEVDAVQCPSDASVVTSHRANIWHRIARGPPDFSLEQCVTRCGWQFGVSRKARIAGDKDLPRVHTQLCQKCLPVQYREAKAAFADAMSAQKWEAPSR